MKANIITLLLVSIFLTSCTSIKSTRQTHRIEPSPVITTNWSPNQYKGITNRCYEDVFTRETIDCITSYSIEKSFYKFKVYSYLDTVVFLIHDSYIGSNVDTISISIDGATDSSEIGVHPNCSWVRLGTAKILLGELYSDYCEVLSTIPVCINVHLIVDPMRENTNPSYREIIKSRKQLEMDSISYHLDRLIKEL